MKPVNILLILIVTGGVILTSCGMPQSNNIQENSDAIASIYNSDVDIVNYILVKNDPKMIDQITSISYSVTILEGEQVSIEDSALYINKKLNEWSCPLILYGDLREILDSKEPGKHYTIIFKAPMELLDFADENIMIDLYVSMEVDGYRMSFIE